MVAMVGVVGRDFEGNGKTKKH